MSTSEAENKGRTLVRLLAIVALVVVTLIDAIYEKPVSSVVYGGLIGAIIGTDALKKLFK